MEFEVEDGIHDLWRKTILKFYNKLIGGRDYGIFEVMHFGLHLPGTLSSFGNVDSCSVSNWSALKHPVAIATLKSKDRCSTLSKLELFNLRMDLEQPTKMSQDDLESISFYAFWRLYYVNGTKIVQRRKEKMIAINGAGWPRQAKRSHEKHVDYANKTLYAYMPCAGSSGSSYVDAVVTQYYKGSYPAALEAFVHDPLNKWCPTWIRRNYDVQNSDEAHDQDALAVPVQYVKFIFEEDDPDKELQPEIQAETILDPQEQDTESARVTQKPIYVKLQHLPLDAGEPSLGKTNDDPEIHHDENHWMSTERPKWQLHSALGPNLNPEALVYKKEALQEHVNPVDYDYSQAAKGINLPDLREKWQKCKRSIQSTVTNHLPSTI